MIARVLSFATVGAAAFLIDAGVLAAMIHLAGLPPLPARGVSFASALAFTYVANRATTFKDRATGRGTFISYALASGLASAANLGVYAVVVSALANDDVSPFLGVVCGTLAGMTINFTLYNWVVFRRRR